MELATIIGLIVGWSGLLGCIIMEGGVGILGNFIKPSAFLIVVVGSIGATIASFTMDQIRNIGKIIRQAFTQADLSPGSIIQTLVTLAERARREGLLVLEDDAKQLDDPFLQKGIQLVVDGTDMELVRNILHTELSFLEQRHKVGENIFMTAAGFSPTMGIIGAVVGLINALGAAEDPAEAAHAVALAFVATVYGLSFANLVLLPISNKLKIKSAQELLLREIMVEGILSIQAGDNPRIVEEKLKAFLPPAVRQEVEKRGGAGERRPAEALGGAG